jgi:hypothetical protein
MITGTVKVPVEYGADGKVGFIIPFQTLPFGLTQASVFAAKGIRFEPAMINGKAVPLVTVVYYNFDIY